MPVAMVYASWIHHGREKARFICLAGVWSCCSRYFSLADFVPVGRATLDHQGRIAP